MPDKVKSIGNFFTGSFFNLINQIKLRSKPKRNEHRNYYVFVDDNFHYMDEGERYNAACFDSYQEAVKYCKDFMDKELICMYKQGMTAEKLYDDYTDFGEDPYIRPNDDDEEYFSAWDYAKEKSKEICKIE